MVNEQQPGEQLDAKGAARRRFTRAGAAASGVLLTVHSQPGMAAKACTTPSGYHSITYGSHSPRYGSCSGKSPGGWKAKLNGANNKLIWPVNPTTTNFNIWFTAGTATAATLGLDSTKLSTVLNSGPGFDPYNLGKHFVAAYLNYLAKLSPYPTPEMLVAMWNATQVHPYTYEPNAGAEPWDIDFIKKYLSSTWV